MAVGSGDVVPVVKMVSSKKMTQRARYIWKCEIYIDENRYTLYLSYFHKSGSESVRSPSSTFSSGSSLRRIFLLMMILRCDLD